MYSCTKGSIQSSLRKEKHSYYNANLLGLLQVYEINGIHDTHTRTRVLDSWDASIKLITEHVCLRNWHFPQKIIIKKLKVVCYVFPVVTCHAGNLRSAQGLLRWIKILRGRYYVKCIQTKTARLTSQESCGNKHATKKRRRFSRLFTVSWKC